MNTKSFEKIINEAWENRSQVSKNSDKKLLDAISDTINLLDLELTWSLLFQASLIIFSKYLIFIMQLLIN